MATYKLRYFVEGKDGLASVTISNDKFVEDMRKDIYRKYGRSYWNGAEAMELVLLKVCDVRFLFQLHSE